MSASMPRAHTPAELAHAGIPMRLPARSAGDVIRSERTNMAVCRYSREGKTGMPTIRSSPLARIVPYCTKLISDTSQSPCSTKRRNISGIGSLTNSGSAPSMGIRPSTTSRTWS